jgi:sugar/nucleoside kinase (ribokinase family)
MDRYRTSCIVRRHEGRETADLPRHRRGRLAECQPVAQTVRFAAAAAAAKCARFGGRDGIPGRAAVERLLHRSG